MNFEMMNLMNQEVDFPPIVSFDADLEQKEVKDLPEHLPILPLKNTILFPGVVIPITVGRNKSIKAIQQAYDDNKLIGVFSQKEPSIENPTLSDLFPIGTLASIIKLLRMPDGTITAIIQGRQRIRVKKVVSEEPIMSAAVESALMHEVQSEMEFKATLVSIKDLAKKIIELSPNIPNEANIMLNNINQDAFLLNFIASNLNVETPVKQQYLEQDNPDEKAKDILSQLDKDYQLLQLKDQIENKVRTDIDKQQRDYYLNQQLKTIQDELGYNVQEEELGNLSAKAATKKWNDKAKTIFEKELNKLKRMSSQQPEYASLFNYLEVLTSLPWEEYSEDNFDLRHVKEVLDQDHYGLDKIKERILEHLAVLKLKGDLKAPILLLVGPPGVGKTSLGSSIAKALNRKYLRMSLGGLHDESEIRGHRKTYIGAMPGRIIQQIKKSETSNPVFILDEIDKLGKDFRGDPSSALLEVLDPEQNGTFYDNYLEMEYDLSKVMFIATANSLSTIQPALLDRMEVIELSGYSLEEKLEIAHKHLIPQQLEAHGLHAEQVTIEEECLKSLCRLYTRESGVRSLHRTIGSLMRHAAKRIAFEEVKTIHFEQSDLEKILGPAIFNPEIFTEQQSPGVAVGLAWTSMGGDILFIEATKYKGKGSLHLTGNLGDVMKESASTALSYIKANSDFLNIDTSKTGDYDIHIHVPEGAIPKDGPSAGITMLTAITSVLLEKPIKPFLAMTGEITLRGKVLPVGGIKEKILAAKRAGIREIILCKDNQKHVEEIPAQYTKGLTFHYVNTMQEVLDKAIVH